MKFYNYLNEGFTNWVFPNKQTISMDFKEYSKKENTKWKNRAQSMGFRFPLFNDANHFESELKKAKIIEIDDNWVNKITHLTDIDDIESLRSMVGSYRRPRDIDRIIDGFSKGDKMPYPIILKGNRGYHIMAGNTRINTARIMDIKPKVLLVDIGE